VDEKEKGGAPLSKGTENSNPWRRQKRAVAYENNWITVYHDEVRRPDNRPGVYGVVHYRNRSVGVVAIDSQDRVLLVGQFRYTLDRYSWEIPAGGCPGGEDTFETARRELQEETGYKAKSMRLLVRAHMSNCITDEEGYCYLAKELTPGPPVPEGTEDLQVRWEDFANVLQRIAAGEITDALTIIALQQTAILRLTDNIPIQLKQCLDSSRR
jgi:8-oxo-dGTP pyrophosphatase MutT (NUDIX family)